jgi:hypothetical protein
VLAERFRRGKLQRARGGHWIASEAPYGYRYVLACDGAPAHLEIDAAEAEVVRMLYRWLIDERTSVRQILKRLADCCPRCHCPRLTSDARHIGHTVWSPPQAHDEGVMRPDRMIYVGRCHGHTRLKGA